MASVSLKTKSDLSGSSSSFTSDPEIGNIIDNLPLEYLEAMKKENVILVSVHDIKKPLSQAIYNSKKEEIIKPLRSQINFKVPKSLKNSTDDTIKKDLLFYKKAYETEAASINEIIHSTNMLNKQLKQPLTSIKETLKNYQKDFKKNISCIDIPFTNKKEGLDSIVLSNNNEEQKKIYEENVNDINQEINSYQKDSINFFKEYSKMNQELSDEIKSFIESFNQLTNSVTKLKDEITNGFQIFENCAPEFEELEDTERIRNATKAIIDPLNTITMLINKSKEELLKTKNSQTTKNKNGGLAEKMMEVCEELQAKATSISNKINEARLKVNLNKMKFPELTIKEPDIDVIKSNIDEVKDKIEKTNEKNEIIKNEVMKKTDEFINKSRLDILFIIDTTNSINTYLNDIKNNFTYMINSIVNNCPTATIFTGFIGYSDFSELDLGEKYINIDFTDNSNEINEKIKGLESKGGGDEAEDLCGAFDLALQLHWKGFSRFSILATDAPCHGKEFHEEEVEDNYPDGDPEKRDIKKEVRELAEKKISLFCARFADSTEKMFEIFKKEYNKGKPSDSDSQFTVEKCENICDMIIKKASDIYKSRKVEENKDDKAKV
jgi:hypothetical protein